MVIVYLYDALNGFRYRKISLSYYDRITRSDEVAERYVIVSAWIVPL